MGLLEDYFVPLHNFYLTPDSFDQKVCARLRRGSAFFTCNTARHAGSVRRNPLGNEKAIGCARHSHRWGVPFRVFLQDEIVLTIVVKGQ